jgi:hypothetical protein
VSRLEQSAVASSRVVLKHLLKDGKEISRERLIQAKVNKLMNYSKKLTDSAVKAAKETSYKSHFLKSKAIPSPKLLVKDHKKKDK